MNKEYRYGKTVRIVVYLLWTLAIMLAAFGFISVFNEAIEQLFSMVLISDALVFAIFANYINRDFGTTIYRLEPERLLYNSYKRDIKIPFKAIYNLRKTRGSLYITFIYLDKNNTARLRRIRINWTLVGFKEFYEVLNKACHESIEEYKKQEEREED